MWHYSKDESLIVTSGEAFITTENQGSSGWALAMWLSSRWHYVHMAAPWTFKKSSCNAGADVAPSGICCEGVAPSGLG